MIHGSPEIEVGDSLTAFAKRLFGYDPNGKEIRKLKDQLGSLSAAMIRLAVTRGDQAFQLDTKVITAFDLWFPKDERQRVLWPSIVRLSLDYFESLQRHAVPLDERAIAALSHSSMGLDIYAGWRSACTGSSRVKPPSSRGRRSRRSSAGTMAGWTISGVFRQTLDMVAQQYRGARLEMDGRGMTLRNSLPPIPGRFAVVRKP